jgi:hypothetical protein
MVASSRTFGDDTLGVLVAAGIPVRFFDSPCHLLGLRSASAG